LENQIKVEARTLGSAFVLDLYGDLSSQAEEQLIHLRPWEQGLGPGERFLVFNPSHVLYINSMGIAALFRIVRALSKAGHQTFAYGVSPHSHKLFRMVGLTRHMTICPDEYTVIQQIEALPQ